MKNYPKYVRCGEYIGVFQYVDDGFPIYRFPGGDRVADGYELAHGSNNRAELEKELWKIAAEQYKFNVNDMYGDYVGSADTLTDAEKIKANYEAETGIEAYVFDNSIDYSGRPVKRGDKA